VVPTTGADVLPSAVGLPTAATVTRVAGSTRRTSSNWVGYTFSLNNVTGAEAQWTEPVVTGSRRDEEFIWVGVGGSGYTWDNIAQIGTFEYFPAAGGLNKGVWYQFVPTNQRAQYPLIPVKPGDRIFASVVEVHAAAGHWTVSLQDLSNGLRFDKTVEFHSLNSYPTFVVEDPSSTAADDAVSLVPLPRWSPVEFRAMQVRIGMQWVPAATLPNLRLTMVQHGRTLAMASPLNAQSGFTASRI
jgi:Peptidase A4 family